MSLSFALSNAFTGLKANSTQADLIANNVANALTEGYGRRGAELSVGALGGGAAGVRVDGVARASAPVETAARLFAEADEGRSGLLAETRRRIADAVGAPGDAAALSSRADALDAALAAAADTPESAAFLQAAVVAADEYAAAINRVAAEVVSLRTEADSSIARQVDTINATLTKLQSLNAEIKSRSVAGADISALEDQRERLIKDVSAMIPVKTVKRPNDDIALYARNGGQLLDGAVYPLGFTRTALVSPERSIEAGTLSGLTVGGNPVRIGEGDGGGLFDGGSLAAAFETRDRVAPETADALDDLAADLILRTQGLPEDATLAPGAAGLFTDGGGAFDPANTVGIAGRVALNAAVDVSEGGAAFRLRDGLGAAAPGDAGNGAILRGLQDALAARVDAPGGSVLTGSRGAAGFAAELSAASLASAASAETASVFSIGRADELRDAEKARTGVDTDQELARLLVVEQSFAANARVIEVIDELMERLTRL